MTTPEAITVDLKHAKALKRVGWPQERVGFCHLVDQTGIKADPYWWGVEGDYWHEEDFIEWFAAPTAEEILRKLPKTLSGSVFWPGDPGLAYLNIKAWTDSFTILYRTATNEFPTHRSLSGISADTLANAAAACYCYLADHKLL